MSFVVSRASKQLSDDLITGISNAVLSEQARADRNVDDEWLLNYQVGIVN